MAYYSDVDRERAALRRKLNSQIKQVMESPEDAYDIFGITVPKVTKEPTLKEYGLPSDIEKRLAKVDEEYVRTEKSKRKTTAFIITAIIISLFFYFMSQGNPTNHPENYNYD